MYYVDTKTENYNITTSYVTEKQARRYGGEPYLEEIYLTVCGDSAALWHYPDDGEIPDEISEVGIVRTVFKSHMDASEAGDFMLYLLDAEIGWKYSGISFVSYSDANQAVKGPLSRTFGKMLIVERQK